METNNKKSITVETTVNVPVNKAWEFWTAPEHITKWNNASDDWHSPKAQNDVRTGGTFNIRMEARDGSAGFDFGGIYDEVKKHELISYTMGDDRKVKVTFLGNGDTTRIIETFEAETENSEEVQRGGWQAIMDNFKRYAEEQPGTAHARS